MFQSLDFVYVPAPDFDSTLEHYTRVLGAEVLWKVRGMGTIVAALQVSEKGPALLLSEHLEGEVPILVHVRRSTGAQPTPPLRPSPKRGGEIPSRCSIPPSQQGRACTGARNNTAEEARRPPLPTVIPRPVPRAEESAPEGGQRKNRDSG